MSLPRVDGTHALDLGSWVESAVDAATEFPIQNLPLGCARHRTRGMRPCTAIGDRVVDLTALAGGKLVPPSVAALLDRCATTGSLNPLLGAGRAALASLRASVSAALRGDGDASIVARRMASSLLLEPDDTDLVVPAHIGDYTDFYASIHHAATVGAMFRPDAPLLPNYKWLPLGYHGRASSIVASGQPVRRPCGQTRGDAAQPPVFGPSRQLDYEIEVGAFIGAGNGLGTPIAMADAESHVAGLCLVNDWSARDIQAWEYQPLGPFLAKSFATTISPWIVTLDALAPFRVPVTERPPGDPPPLPYLDDAGNRAWGAVDITLEVCLASARMRTERLAPHRVSTGLFRSMYWSIAQLVTHHASNGANLRPGDLLASGTVSGAEPGSEGCLLERTARGTRPLVLPTGEQRRFLEDGDEVTMRAWCERGGARRIGFGGCTGLVIA